MNAAPSPLPVFYNAWLFFVFPLRAATKTKVKPRAISLKRFVFRRLVLFVPFRGQICQLLGRSSKGNSLCHIRIPKRRSASSDLGLRTSAFFRISVFGFRILILPLSAAICGYLRLITDQKKKKAVSPANSLSEKELIGMVLF